MFPKLKNILISGWWFQPLWKNISQFGFLFPRSGNKQTYIYIYICHSIVFTAELTLCYPNQNTGVKYYTSLSLETPQIPSNPTSPSLHCLGLLPGFQASFMGRLYGVFLVVNHGYVVVVDGSWQLRFYPLLLWLLVVSTHTSYEIIWCIYRDILCNVYVTIYTNCWILTKN